MGRFDRRRGRKVGSERKEQGVYTTDVYPFLRLMEDIFLCKQQNIK